MKFVLEYKNDNPAFIKEIDTVPGWSEPILNLSVEGKSGRSRQEALADVLVNLECLFRELKNMHNTDIKTMKVEVPLRGTFKKTDEDVIVELQSQFNKYNMIVYSFYSDVFSEKLLFTSNNNTVKRSGGNLSFEGNAINEDLLSIAGKTQDRKFLDSLLITVRTFLPDYDIRIDPETKHLRYAYKGSLLNDIEDIQDDDVFLYFKFIEVLLTKNTHFGIFFIDASLFKPNVLSALVAFINLTFLNNRLVFLYNIDKNKASKLNRLPYETVVFPNHKLSLKVRKELEKKSK